MGPGLNLTKTNTEQNSRPLEHRQGVDMDERKGRRNVLGRSPSKKGPAQRLNSVEVLWVPVPYEVRDAGIH